MFIQVFSDLHLEFEGSFYPSINKNADVLVYAGDVSCSEDIAKDYFSYVRTLTDVPIIYILGNHEYYGKFISNGFSYKKVLKDISDLYVLNKGVFSYNGVNFIGCTLWSDFDNGSGVYDSLNSMSDYKYIKKLNKYFVVDFVSPDDLIQEYNDCLDFLRSSFLYLKSGKNVVITHHAPSYYCLSKRLKNTNFASSYCSELSNFILTVRPDLWVHGHIHEANKMNIGSTRIVCNPVGYPKELKIDIDTGYENDLLIEV